MVDYEFVCCVVNMGGASNVLKIAKKYDAQGETVTLGRGSVYGYMSATMGFSEDKKEIIGMIIKRENTADAIKSICGGMKLARPEYGIAFSVPLTELIGAKGWVKDSAESSEGLNYMYQIIYVVADRGMAEDIIDAAYMAGARGGTIIDARGKAAGEPKKLFSAERSGEKEIVFIITKTELKDGIIKSIRELRDTGGREKCVVYVANVNEVYGLHEHGCG